MKYRKKPVVIEAVQWKGDNLQEIDTLAGGFQKGAREYEQDFISDDLIIHTLEGDMKARKGDWIIRGIKNELYPCKSDIFEQTYESV